MMRFCFQFGVSRCASPALLVQRTKGRNVTWDETNLDEYLQGPGKFVRGTKMVYFVPNEKDRQDMIAYVKASAYRNLGHVGLARRTGFSSIEAQRA